jgi:hypothetical protein
MNPLLLIALSLVAADWDNLKEITKDRGYAVILRDGRCVKGRIVSSDDRQVVFGAEKISREAVLRITDGTGLAHDAVYSGRSSWSDVAAASPQASEYLRVVTKRGEQFKWKRPTISAKGEVRTISFFRFKPLTSTEEYFSHENVDYLSPRLRFTGLLLGKIEAEDNSAVACR